MPVKIDPPPPGNVEQPGVTMSLLYNGSRFQGHQKSKGNSYDVEVILQHVDMHASYLCGYLKIKGLTEEYPTLTTFFDGEIIGEKHPFLTRKWDADEEVDKKHWGKFLSFFQFKNFNSDKFDYEDLKKRDFVFMRWKSKFMAIYTVLYGCESWVISHDMENKINSFATSCYRVMLNIKQNDHIPNAKIYTMTNTKILLERVRSQQLKFLGHIHHQPDGELAKVYTLYAWKMMSWPSAFLLPVLHTTLTRDEDITFDPANVASLAQDLRGWRKIVVTCSVAARW